jgi:hypothetical protein
MKKGRSLAREDAPRPRCTPTITCGGLQATYSGFAREAVRDFALHEEDRLGDQPGLEHDVVELKQLDVRHEVRVARHGLGDNEAGATLLDRKGGKHPLAAMDTLDWLRLT